MPWRSGAAVLWFLAGVLVGMVLLGAAFAPRAL